MTATRQGGGELTHIRDAMRLRNRAHQMQAEASRLYREADEIEHRAILEHESAEAASHVTPTRLAAAVAEENLTRSTREVQRTENDVLKAANWLAECQAKAHRTIARNASPQAQSEAAMLADKAAEVLRRQEATAAAAIAARKATSETLSRARAELAAAEDSAADAASASAHPIPAGLSLFTVKLDPVAAAMGQHGQLSDGDAAVIRNEIETLAELCGAADLIRADGQAEERERAEEERQAAFIKPLPGHQRRIGTARNIVHATAGPG